MRLSCALDWQRRLVALTAAGLLAMLMMQAGTAAADASQWYLMARHGECAPIAVLERKVAGAGAARHPDELVRYLEAEGLAVEVASRDLQQGMVQINVPEKSLYLVLVKAPLCRGFTQPR